VGAADSTAADQGDPGGGALLGFLDVTHWAYNRFRPWEGARFTAYLPYWVFCAPRGTKGLNTVANLGLRTLDATLGYSRNPFLFNVLGANSGECPPGMLRTSPIWRGFPNGFRPRGRHRGYLLLLGAHLIASAVGLGPLHFPGGVCRSGNLTGGLKESLWIQGYRTR
jgi:hypothetical protein